MYTYELVITAVIAAIVGAVLYHLIKNRNILQKNQKAEEMLEEAKRKLDKMERDAYLAAKEKLYQEKSQFIKQMRQKESEFNKSSEKLRQKEKELRKLGNKYQEKEWQIAKREQELIRWEQTVQEKEKEVNAITEEQLEILEDLSGLNRDEAKDKLKEEIDLSLLLDLFENATFYKVPVITWCDSKKDVRSIGA